MLKRDHSGWGLQFVEGWDFKKLWILVFVVFGLGCLVLGMLWAVYKHSIQDVFAIAVHVNAISNSDTGLRWPCKSREIMSKVDMSTRDERINSSEVKNKTEN